MYENETRTTKCTQLFRLLYERETEQNANKKDENYYKCSHISKAKTVKLIAFAISLCVNAHLIAIPILLRLHRVIRFRMDVCSLYEVLFGFCNFGLKVDVNALFLLQLMMNDHNPTCGKAFCHYKRKMMMNKKRSHKIDNPKSRELRTASG